MAPLKIVMISDQIALHSVQFPLFICDFLEFPLVKYSNIFTAHSIQWNANFRQEKSRVFKVSFFIFTNICLLLLQKTGLIDFHEKKLKLKLHQILKNFTEENTRKFTISFAFCAHIDVIKY